MPKLTILLALLLAPCGAFAHGDDPAHGEPEHNSVVDRVIPGSAAAAAGLLAGDRIKLVGDLPLQTSTDLERIVQTYKPGQTVPLVVDRDGEILDLELTFGARPGGGPSIGVALQLVASSAEGDATNGTAECLDWIADKYRIEEMARRFDIDWDFAALRECVSRDTRAMGRDRAVKYCDNIFKVHCSALDLLTEIGEAQVAACETVLAESLGIRPNAYRAWNTCGESAIFDRYSRDGAASDAEDCRTALLECGTSLDDAVAAGTLSAEQRAFVACCSANAVGDACEMLDDGFERGPCHDRPVCVDRTTADWMTCPTDRIGG